MDKQLRRLLVLLLAVGLVMPGCVQEEEGASDNDDVEITEEDRSPPLHDADELVGDAPDNDQLPEVAKADETFPAQFDLVDLQSPVSDQGSRGVCSIFSTVGLMEHLYIKAEDQPDPDFSEQYLQWSAKEQVGRFTTSSGSNASANLSAIHQYGIVEEDFWEYQPQSWDTSDDEACDGEDQPTRCYTQGPPPEQAQDAPKWRLPSDDYISTRVRDIKSYMHNNEQGVIVGGDFFYQAWNHSASDLPTNKEYWRKGYVVNPNETDIEKSLEDRAGHSFLLVGWNDELEVERMNADGEVMTDENGDPVTEQGFFIFKNSWGTGSFGVDNPHGDGYGFISYEYVQEHLRGRVADVPGPEHVPEDTEGLDCDSGELECNNECVPVDADNCGECGNTCDSGKVCQENQCVVPEGTEQAYGWDGDSLDIPDDDTDGVTAEIEVQNSGLINELETDVTVDHSYRGDVRIELTAPTGDSVVLREADGAWGHDVDETYSVDEFDGEEAEGTWELTVSDRAEYDEGSLQDWALRITH